jgi:hypothetical protein
MSNSQLMEELLAMRELGITVSDDTMHHARTDDLTQYVGISVSELAALFCELYNDNAHQQLRAELCTIVADRLGSLRNLKELTEALIDNPPSKNASPETVLAAEVAREMKKDGHLDHMIQVGALLQTLLSELDSTLTLSRLQEIRNELVALNEKDAEFDNYLNKVCARRRELINRN